MKAFCAPPSSPSPWGFLIKPILLKFTFPWGGGGGPDALASIAPVEQVRKAHNATVIKSLKCGVITLDMFVQTTGIQQPHLVKIDVEGAECKVLAGGHSVFEHQQQPILFMELVAPWLREFGNTPWDALGYLQSAGYQHLFMCPEGLVEHHATQASPYPAEFRMWYNVISYVPGRHAWVRERLEPFLASKKPKLPPMDPPTLPNE